MNSEEHCIFKHYIIYCSQFNIIGIIIVSFKNPHSFKEWSYFSFRCWTLLLILFSLICFFWDQTIWSILRASQCFVMEHNAQNNVLNNYRLLEIVLRSKCSNKTKFIQFLIKKSFSMSWALWVLLLVVLL